MRESLTVLAILLIVVLTTALVGPYFVDWNAHRGEIEARLSSLLGSKVTVAGPIDVKLLPRPIFRLRDLTVAGKGPQAGTITAAGVDMELSLTALMRGDIQFVEADLDAPTVTVPVGPDGSIALPPEGSVDPERISLLSVTLRDGTLVLHGTDGRPLLTATGIDGAGRADSLAGPFKFEGSVDTPRGPLALRIATGVVDGGHMRLKVGLDPSDGVPKTDIDGLVVAAGPGGSTGVAFDGTLAANGAAALPGATKVVPWRVTSRLHAQPGSIALDAGELRAGLDGRALIATLSGTVTSGPRPAAHLIVHGRQADLGKLAVSPDQAGDDATVTHDPTAASPPLGDDLAMLAALAGDADLTAGLPLPVTLEGGLESVAAGSLALLDLNGTVTLTPGQPIAGTVTFATPDGGQAAFEGTFEPGPGAVFKGRVEASTPHLQRFADTLGTDLPAAAAALRQALPIDAFRAAGTIDLSGIGFAAHDVTVALDHSDFAGTVTLTRGVGADRPRLFADLTSEALDLDALPGWRDAAAAASDLDVSLSLVARALRFAAGDTGSLHAGRIALQLDKKGKQTTLDHLSLADIGGATAEITGQSDGVTAHADARLDASKLHDLLMIAARLMPGALSEGLLARADALSPALLTLSADARLGQDGSLSPTLLTVGGTAAATRVTLDLRPEGRPEGTEASASPPFALDLGLDAPDAGALLRQAGLAPRAGTGGLGHARVNLSAHRDATGVGTGSLTASFGDTLLSADGHREAGGHATGHLAVKSPNAAPLASALLAATPEAGAVWPVEASGRTSYADGRLGIEGLAGTLLGSTVRADLSYDLATLSPGNQATPPAVTGTLSVDRLPLPALAALVLGPLPAPKAGSLWPDAPFAPPVLALPRSDIALKVATMPLTGGAVAQGVMAALRLEPGSVTLADLAAALGSGRIGGTLTLRRDEAAASLAGHLDWSGLPLATPSLGGISHGSLDLAGSGTGAAALVGSLAGSGQLGIDNARLPRFDPGAASRVIAGADTGAAGIDAVAIAQDLGQQLDRGAMPLGSIATPVTVAAGVLRAGPVRAASDPVMVEVAGSLDLSSLLLSLKATATLSSPPKDWVGAPPQIGVLWKGPFNAPAREVDGATLVNGIAARAIARDQARIEAFQDDIRERAFFARRLRAIEAEQQAVRDKAKADQDAADKLRLQQFIDGLPATPAPPHRPGLAVKPLELH